MKITVDRSKCTGLGICESLSPDVFEVDDAGELVLKTDTVPAGILSDVQEAVAGCPTEALRLEP
ncbi:ferredoxin [Streptomyces fuscichromogenes]|uniref:Ferredoxin n=1 Tax=Streptomyces fuscichromogenes TaxID=1324013 RepID=A0A918CT27_9ACTN|nr:ferredoxin [Streptomyces fuscichromogenes]GGN19944.1 4Fe-4S ferredoxin [Streptomyces fuscichromogenes]